jgi:hypothetical protein
MIRDNFYDMNIAVIADKPFGLPLGAFFRRMSYGEYMGHITQCGQSRFGGWSTEEMAHPGILRALVDGRWREVSGGQKDRWVARMHSTEWFDRDWSGGHLSHVGPVPFNESTEFYHQPRAYAEGMWETCTCAWDKPYSSEATAFILAQPGNRLEHVLRLLREHS